jgi:translocation and assembly module TamB
VEASAAPLRLAIARQQPMRGKFSADGEIKPLWDLLVGGERSVSGVVSMAGTIGGTLADPRLAGQASLKSGTFEDGAIGLKLRDLGLTAYLADKAIDVSGFTRHRRPRGQAGGRRPDQPGAQWRQLVPPAAGRLPADRE